MEQRAPRRRLTVDERRAEILRCGVALAREVGLVGLTLRAVRERAGVSAGLANHYFSSLGGLRVAVFEALFGGTAREHGSAPVERLAGIIEAAVSPAVSDEARIWVDALQLGRTDADMQRAVVAQMTADREEMTEVIRTGCATGEFHSEDPARSARRILVVVDGYLMQFLVEKGEIRSALRRVVWDVAERELGLAEGALRGSSTSGMGD